MMMRMTTAAAMMIAMPAMAQTKPAAVPVAPSVPAPVFVVQPIPPTDPARLAAARPVIDRIWPTGSYARMMHTMMGPFMQGSIAQTMNMKPDELIPGIGAMAAKTGEKPKESQTLGQMAAEYDPYFQQRMALTMDAVGDEMGKIMTEVEPGIRDALAHAYARRFTVEQLGELDRFFATPTGAAYVSDQMTLMMSPDLAQAMQGFIPRMVKAAPEMIARIEAATKDLPPPNRGGHAAPPVISPPPPVKTP